MLEDQNNNTAADDDLPRPPSGRRSASRPAGPPAPIESKPAEPAPVETPAAAPEPVATEAPVPGSSAEPTTEKAAPRKRASRKKAEAPAAEAPRRTRRTRKTAEPSPEGGEQQAALTAEPAPAESGDQAEAPAPEPARPARKRTTRKKAAAEPVAEEPTVEPPATEEQPAAEEQPAEQQPTEASVAEQPAAADQSERSRAALANPFQPPQPVETPAAEADDAEDGDEEETEGEEPEGSDHADSVDRDSEDDDSESEDSDSDDSDSDADDQSNGGRRRRRRRGGRRRRRGGSGDDNDNASDDSGNTAQESGDGADTADSGAKDDQAKDDDSKDSDSGSDDADEQSSGGRRRRRRRRRRGEAGSNDDDENVEVVDRVREPRRNKSDRSSDEVTGIEGSTRMEAKRQRRKEGRAAGRRRAPILSEAEFLARRESVERTMVIRQNEELSQIGVLEDGVLVEHYVDRASATSLIGNVYLGKVQNVLPSMEAAFIDIGRGRNAVLYAGEVDWDSFGADGQNRKMEKVLKSGQSILVQVTKDPVGAKGARLTNHISLPGRYIVYAPGGHLSGISRKLPDNERKRLKDILAELVGDDASVIVRTAAEGASTEELVRDVNRLKAQWEAIEKKTGGSAPQQLYAEPDATVRIVRDLFTEDFSKLVIDGNQAQNDAYDTVTAYVAHVAPHLSERIEKWDRDQGDIFAAHRVDEQIAKALERKVFLPSGGSLIIDRTEAMTVIDVNTGKFTGSGGNLEATVTSNNLEAAEEVVRQLRLRDIGGIIVVDFIDMVLPSNRELLLRRLVECLGRDRTRHQVAEVTSLGLVQMTRKKIGTGLAEAFTESCETCKGRGYLIHDMPVETQAPSDGGDRHGGRGGRGGRNRGGDQNRRGKDKSEKNDKNDKSGRGEKKDRSEKNDRDESNDRGDKNGQDRSRQNGQPQQQEHKAPEHKEPEQPETPPHAHNGQPDRTEQPDQQPAQVTGQTIVQPPPVPDPVPAAEPADAPLQTPESSQQSQG
ncbi:Rne/Rng family ribonuclease [Enemella evansiae]|uniref:Rne/Rng family ribonuclease n=1 Tax=Enemella evansiae TaxID=2016499 RepID=UPI000B96BCE3|nr:Rne/Rng family ribonuclease [Enemella evansiae]OYO05984.1 ribonuclease [Enemella evansiae]